MRFYKIALWKAYFDTGYGLMSMPKYILILLGFGDTLASAGNNKVRVLIYGAGFGLLCFILGWLMFKSGFQKATIEVQNNYNLFVAEVRNKLIGVPKKEKYIKKR